MRKLVTILPFYFFTSLAYGQYITSTDTVKVKVLVINGYIIKAATNLWGPGTYTNNNTLFMGSGIDWLMSNHPTILKLRADIDAVEAADNTKLRSDLNTVMTENAKLKTDMAVLKAAVAAHSDAIDAHDSAIVRLQTDSTLMTIVNTGTITKPVWKITTAKQ